MFIHHPDGYVAINNTVFPMVFWLLVEPDYAALPEGYSARIFDAGNKHHLVRANDGSQEPQDLNWAAGVVYQARYAEYVNAYQQYEAGAAVSRINGVLTIRHLTLSSNKVQIENNGTDTATITAQTGDANYTGEITWTVISPTQEQQTATENMVAGAKQLTFSTSAEEGIYIIRAETPEYGIREITVEAI